MTALVPLSLPATSASASAADPRDGSDKTVGATTAADPGSAAALRNGFPQLLGGLIECATPEDARKEPAQKIDNGEAAALLVTVSTLPAPPLAAWVLPLGLAVSMPAPDGETAASPSGTVTSGVAQAAPEQPLPSLFPALEELPRVDLEAPPERNRGSAAESLTPEGKPLTAVGSTPESAPEHPSRREFPAALLPDNARAETQPPVASKPLQTFVHPAPQPSTAAAKPPEAGTEPLPITGLPETPRTESRHSERHAEADTENTIPPASVASSAAGDTKRISFGPNQTGPASQPVDPVEVAAAEPGHYTLAFAARLTPVESSAPQASSNRPAAPFGRAPGAGSPAPTPTPSGQAPATAPQAPPAASDTADPTKPAAGEKPKPAPGATPTVARASTARIEFPADDSQRSANDRAASPMMAAPHVNVDASASAETRPAGATPNPPAPSAPAAHRPVEIAPPAPTTAPSPAREIRLQVDGGERRVDVRLTEQKGEVQVAVRTPDTQLAGALRDELPVLAARLEHSGFHAQIWQPAASPGEPLLRTVAAQASDTPQDFQQPGRQGGQQQPQHGMPRRLPSEAAAPPKEFSWLLSSLG